MPRLQVIDSHTAGEPTRVAIDGGPELGRGPVAERLARLRDEHDWLRSASVKEPRGSEVLVGALLVPPTEAAHAAAGVIFFNNVGYLGMCGHGTMGLVVTLAHLGRIGPGVHRIETPVGVVTATLHEDRRRVSVANVPSYRKAKGVSVRVPGIGEVTGDVAYGGNWFFLTDGHGQTLTLEHVDALTDYTWRLRQAVNGQGFPEVDHVELIAPPPQASSGVSARSFVLCPGKAYDRSPCGTGTSAKIACLAADAELAPGERWVQESVIGTRFVAEYRREEGGSVIPIITGSAHVTAEATLILDESDPLRFGIR